MTSRILLGILCLGSLWLAACTWEQPPEAFAPQKMQPATAFTEEAEVEVSADALAEAREGTAPADIRESLWERGIRQGGRAVVNRFLRDPLILRGGSANDRNITPLVTREGNVTATADAVTGTYNHSFTASGTLVPARKFAGTVVAVEHDRYYSGEHDTIFMEMETDLSPADEAGFFLIAQPLPTKKEGYSRLVGGGRFFQVQGPMVQGRLLETLEEIEIGDTVFLLQLTVTAAQQSAPSPESNASSYPEVVVDPVTEPAEQPSQPKETK
ncbi:MAG: hypothetical protein ACQESV_00670 [Thermodesulfobacteriota bacterium]